MSDRESVIFAKVKSWLTKSGKSSTSYQSRSAGKTPVITLLWHTSSVIDKRQKQMLAGWLKPNGNARFTYAVKSRASLSHSGSQVN